MHRDGGQIVVEMSRAVLTRSFNRINLKRVCQSIPYPCAVTRSDRRWQVGLLALCALCGFIFTAEVASGTLTASEGLDFRVEASGTPNVGRIEGVATGSLAQNAGLRDGDLVPFAKLDPEVRYRLLSGVYGHKRLTIVVMRDGSAHTIAYTSGPEVPQTRWDLLLADVATVWMLFFAVLLAWRRPELPEARALSAFLALNQLFGDIGPGDWASPSLFLDVAVCLVAYLVVDIAPALMVYYARLFAAPPSPLRRILTAAAYVTAGTGVLGAVYILFGSVYGFVDPFETHIWVRSALAASWLVPIFAYCCCRPWSGARTGRLDDAQREPTVAGDGAIHLCQRPAECIYSGIHGLGANLERCKPSRAARHVLWAVESAAARLQDSP